MIKDYKNEIIVQILNLRSTVLANYVLVHGGGNDGSVWNKVIPFLENQGHSVLAPSLSPAETSSLSEHIDEICNLLKGKRLNNVILVGHSYASFVITGVADRIAERLKRLVYVDSSIPENGKSLFDMIELCGSSYKDFEGLTSDKPYIEKLYFDAETIKHIPKTYIHCTHSEFFVVCKHFARYVTDHARQDNWKYFELDSDHGCMFSHPQELAELLMRESS